MTSFTTNANARRGRRSRLVNGRSRWPATRRFRPLLAGNRLFAGPRCVFTGNKQPCPAGVPPA